MKKLSFLLFVFYSLTLESKANWTRFYENWGDENKDEILSCSPLLRLEIRRHERGNQNYFDVELYKIENNNRIEIFNKKDQNLSRHRPIKEEIHFGSRYNNKIFTMNLDSQSNIIDIGDLSLNHNFDIVTNMRLRLLGSLSSNKQVRVFSEYEVNNPERIQGNPFIVMDDRSLLKKVLNDHIEKNPQLLNSSKDKDIVVFLGNTGSGKSTLMNYLSNKNLKVDDEDNIVLSNPSDSSAMRIGTGARSETLLPRFVEIDNLRMYDFPGFGDTRGTSVSLVNACFIKHILERAKTVRLMFIAGYDEVTASRGALFKDLSNTAKNLLPDDQIEECSALTITKSPANKEKGKLIQILQNRTERGILDIWIEQRKLAKMSSPFDQKINQNDRQDILKIIEETPYKKLTNVNIQATYNSSNLDHLRKVYFEEMQEIFVKLREENFKEGSLSSLDIEALTKMKKSFEAACFFSNLEEKLQQSALITLLRPISDNIYTEAWNSKKKELALDLRSLEDIIEEEITKRKRNLLVSPQDFAKTLNSIADISELLKKSQVPLNHKKSWATEALNEICNRNYSSIREWLKNILSKKYSKLQETHKTYLIPEVCGKDGAWEFYNTPMLYKLVFEKTEDDQTGYNHITFITYPLATNTNPLKKEVAFKYTRHTEETNRALKLDSGYQQLFAREKKLNEQLEDCARKYSKEREKKDNEKKRQEKAASNTKEEDKKIAQRYFDKGYKPGYKNWHDEQVILYKGDIERFSKEENRLYEIYDKKLETTQSWYDDEIIKIDRNEKNEKEEINTGINNLKLQKERYENETYRKTTTTYSKEKQINDIFEKIIKPNFNIRSFIGAIEFEDPDAMDDSNLQRERPNKKRKRSSLEKKREDSKRSNPKRKKEDTCQQS